MTERASDIRITCLVGARPNFVKMAALVQELQRRPCFSTRLVHTGQHYSPEMSASFFTDLDLPEPDLNLGIGGGTHTEVTAGIMLALERELLSDRPDVLLVVGDVNSTVAGALVASKLEIPLAHVEAGLRSFDRRMPEEINRVVTDLLSDYLFVTEPSGVRNLASEGVPPERIHLVGNVMVDTLLRFRDRARSSDVLGRLGLPEKSYAVVTLHRPSNVDDPERLKSLMELLERLQEHVRVVFPVHPRTRQRIEQCAIRASVLLVPPLGYLDFLRLMSEARLVLTDSGGIQEETTILQVPCLTLRENTERPITVEQGTNQLVGVDPAHVLPAALNALGRNWDVRAPELWDGRASVRILDVLESAFSADRQSAPLG
jgi:UDP-N-acetylglucosamine 2-epimerase (non-hydrolysing)